MISEKQLAEWERLANEATPEPWYLHEDAPSIILSHDGGDNCWEVATHVEDNDADFICAAREALPQLIAEVRALKIDRDSYADSWYAENQANIIRKKEIAQIEREADWLAGHHGTDCVQYIDPHWACRDDKSCDDCWREASRIKAATYDN